MREEKRWLRLENGLSHFSLLAANLISNPKVKDRPPTATPIKHQIHHLEPQNIRESILNFTAHFGEINPDMLYLCRWGQSGPEKAVLPFSPLFGESR